MVGRDVKSLEPLAWIFNTSLLDDVLRGNFPSSCITSLLVLLICDNRFLRLFQHYFSALSIRQKVFSFQSALYGTAELGWYASVKHFTSVTRL